MYKTKACNAEATSLKRGHKDIKSIDATYLQMTKNRGFYAVFTVAVDQQRTEERLLMKNIIKIPRNLSTKV